MSDQTPDSDGISSDQEPSMEDILASIREVIAKEPALPAAQNLDISEMRDTPLPTLVSKTQFATLPELTAQMGEATVDLAIPNVDTVTLSDVMSDDLVMGDTLDLVVESASTPDTGPLDLDTIAVESGDGFDDSVLDLIAPAAIDSEPAKALQGLPVERSVRVDPHISNEGPAVDATSSDDLMGDVLAEMDDNFEIPTDTDFSVTEPSEMPDAIEMQSEPSPLDGYQATIDKMLADTQNADDTITEELTRTFIETETDLDFDLDIPEIPQEIPQEVIKEPVAVIVDASNAGLPVDIEALLGDDLVEGLPAPDHVSAPLVDSLEASGSEDDLDLDEFEIETEPDTLQDASTLKSREETDIDLVKSLMADLTDDDFEDDFGDSLPDPEFVTQDTIVDEILDASIAEEDALHAVETARNSAHREVPTVRDIPMDDDLAALALEAETEAQMATQRLTAFETSVGDTDVLVLETPLDDDGVTVDTNIETDDPDDHSDITLAGLGATVVAGTVGVTALSADDDIVDTDYADTDYSDDEIDVEIHYEIEETQEEADMAQTKIVSSARVDRSTEDAAGGAFASLAKTVDRKETIYDTGPAIGDMVNEALKPMLKDWLDKNLKDIVEKAVAKEIKRISGAK